MELKRVYLFIAAGAILLTAGFLAQAGCGTAETPPPGDDSGIPEDASLTDTGGGGEDGSLEDSGLPDDSGLPVDSGLPDSGGQDSGIPADAGHDAGADGGKPDGGVADAGYDAGIKDGGVADSGASSLSFNTDIQPITSSKCTGCHSSNPTNYTWVKSNWVDTGKLRTKLNSGHPSALGSGDRAKMILWLDQGALP